MPLQVTVSGFAEGATIPKRHTCEGEDLSPALTWSGAPPETKSYALIMDDPDAPAGIWNHWLQFDIPAGTLSLPEGAGPKDAGRSGKNDFGRTGYGGPCPPRGHGPHRYYFKIFALDVPSLGLSEGVGRTDLDRALLKHVLAEAQFMGRYERK